MRECILNKDNETSQEEQEQKKRIIKTGTGFYLVKEDGSPVKIKRKIFEGKTYGEFLLLKGVYGWIFKLEDDATKLANNLSKGKSKVQVRKIFNEHAAILWDSQSSRIEKDIADLGLQIDIHEREKQEFINKQISDSQAHFSSYKIFNINFFLNDELPENTPENLKSVFLEKKEHLRKGIAKFDEEIAFLTNQINCLESNKDNLHNVLELLQKNEVGDAEVFVELYRDKYVFDPTEGKNGAFYIWNGLYWEIDLHKSRYEDFDRISDEYLRASKESPNEDIKESAEKRAHQLRTDRRRRSVLETVSSKISFKERWDNFPNFLPCRNGIVDLSSGELINPNPKRYIRKVCPISYKKNAKCPKFESFLNEISLGDDEWVGFLKRSLGYAILGIPSEEILIYWYGEGGRNGKGTLAKLLEDVLGPIVKTLPSEMLLLQRNPPSSSTPSPDLANLEGTRIALFSEINEGRKIDSAKVKNLSGRDTISCRRLYSNIDLQIKPTHTMILQTNYKPKAPSDDNALWSRTLLLPFNARFVRDPDPENENERPLKENLKDELMEEAEGILAWIIQGCIDYRESGLRIPSSIKEHTENYRKENDGIGCFLEERCIEDELFSTKASKMQNSIQEYCEKNGFNKPTPREISTYLKTVRKFKYKRLENGRFWRGVKISEEKAD